VIASAARAADVLKRPWARMMALFAAVPWLIVGLPAAAGLTWLAGDNLIQNFPLRVLVGVDLRNGHAPVWDPYLWSGSPLLSAFNAGAAYPVTWLFAVLPGALAWVVNQVTVEVVAAFGMVVLLRVLGRSWAASGLGALAFTYGGFMAIQSVHIDLVEAGAWLPWAFAGLHRAADPGEGRSASPWVAMVGLAIGMMGLTGATEPIIDGAMVLGLYALWLLWRSRTRVRVLLRVVVGAALGLALASAQLVPGALLQAQSQRAIHNYWYFTSGSMNKSLTILGLDPLVLGTNHLFKVPYFATYNLPEVTSYIGILPLMGLVGLLARRMRRHPETRHALIWYGVLALGLVLTWGDFTPLGHVFFDVPLFNRQRLLSRNLLEVDLALAVLFALWIDHMFIRPVAELPGQARDGARRRRWWPLRWGSDVVLALVPPALVVGMQVVMLAGGTWFPHVIHVPFGVTRSSLLPLVALLTVPSVIAVGAGMLVVHRRRLGLRTLRLLAALMVVDLLVFNVFTQSGPDPNSATDTSSSLANQFAGLVAGQGLGAVGALHRDAIYDPDAVDPVQVDRLGEANLNIIRQLSSVQGYGPVVSGTYDKATGAHQQLGLNPKAFTDGVFDQLDLAVVASLPQYFVHLVTPPPGFPASQVSEFTPIPPLPPDRHAPPEERTPPPTPPSDFGISPPPPTTVTVASGTTVTQYFGAALEVSSVTIPLTADDAPGALPRLGLVSRDGRRTIWLRTPAHSGSDQVTARPGRRAVGAIGIVVQAPASGVTAAPGRAGGLTVGEAVVRTAGQGTYRVDGTLRDAVGGPAWRYAGTIGPFCVFTRTDTMGHAWVTGDPSATARLVSSYPWGDETVRITTSRPATLVRSEQYSGGWQATVSTDEPGGGHTTRHPTVRPHGLIQAVHVPAGTSLVHFTYRPRRVLEGLLISVGGAVALLALATWPRTRRRLVARRARRQRAASSAPPPSAAA
jgi:hypothetical protein